MAVPQLQELCESKRLAIEGGEGGFGEDGCGESMSDGDKWEERKSSKSDGFWFGEVE